MNKNKLEQLRNDLKEARKLALEGISEIKDSGSCNNDSVILYLPRFREEKFHELMNEVGLCGYKTTWIGSICYRITPVGCGMANKRMKSMIIMVEHLKKCGWDASCFYQMD